MVGLVIFYLMRGMVRIESGRSGRSIVRFTAFERFVHWLTATCFIILAISGLNITFGRPVLLPLIGYTLFSWLAVLAKNLHNFVGPVLIVATPWMFVRYVRDKGLGGASTAVRVIVMERLKKEGLL